MAFILAEHNASWGEGRAVLERESFGSLSRVLPHTHAMEGLEIIDPGRGLECFFHVGHLI